MFRKEEFSVIILGLDGAGKTVSTLPQMSSSPTRFEMQRYIDITGEDQNSVQ